MKLEPVKLFISYARKDKKYNDQFITHLKELEHIGLVESWNDQQIKAGQVWEEEIKAALSQAEIVAF